MNFRSRAMMVAFFAVLAYVVIFWRLGAPTFWDPDEAHYAETTREMMASGDYLAPTYQGLQFFDKPIFFHWFQAVPMWMLGPTEGAARAVPAVAALVLAGITWWAGAQLVGGAVGVLASLLLLCNPGVFGLSRYAILDTLMTAFLFGGAASIAVAVVRRRSALQYGGYVALGIATCVKGPISLVLCGLTFACAALVSREARRELLKLHFVRGLAIAMVIAAPWFVYMYERFGRAFVDGYVLKENMQLFTQVQYGNQPGWWFYLGILLTGFLPWTWLAIGRAYDDLKGANGGRRAPDLVDVLLWSWVVAIVLFFSLSEFKLDHYVFPVAPALALLAARGWEDARRADDGTNVGVRFGAALLGPTVILGGIAAAIAAARLDVPRGFLVVPAAVIALGCVATWRYSRPSVVRPEKPLLIVVALVVVYAGVLVWVIPDLERLKVVPDVARWVASHAQASDRVASFRLNRWNPAFRFYVDRPVVTLESDDDARRFFADSSPFYCVMTSDLHAALVRAGVPLQIAYHREGLWVTSGRMLWRREDALTDFVVATRAPQAPGPDR